MMSIKEMGQYLIFSKYSNQIILDITFYLSFINMILNLSELKPKKDLILSKERLLIISDYKTGFS